VTQDMCFCEQRNQSSGSIKFSEFIEVLYLKDTSFSGMGSSLFSDVI